MPTFFFDIITIDGFATKDTVGLELPDVKTATEVAKRRLADMSRHVGDENLSELRIEVRDDAGKCVTVDIASFDDHRPDEDWMFRPPFMPPRTKG